MVTTVVTFLTLVVLTFVLGVPAATYMTVRFLWWIPAGYAAAVLGVRAGIVGRSEGMLGLPDLSWAVLALVLACFWLFTFVRLGVSAWSNAASMFRLALQARANDPEGNDRRF